MAGVCLKDCSAFFDPEKVTKMVLAPGDNENKINLEIYIDCKIALRTPCKNANEAWMIARNIAQSAFMQTKEKE